VKAAPSIDDLLARVPQLGEHTVAPAALAPLPQMRIIERDVRASIAASPGDPRGYAMLGNLLTRQSLYLQARDAYVRAVECDADFAKAHLAAAELSSILRDDDSTRLYLKRALTLRRRFDDPLPVGNRIPVLMLLADAPYAVNAPLEMILDRGRVALHKLYLGREPLEAAPEHAVIFTAFGAGASTVPFTGRGAINRAEFFKGCTRNTLGATLSGVRDIVPVESRAVERAAIETIALPAMVRPAATHAGQGLAYVQTQAELQAHVQRFPAPAYDVAAFMEYRSDDGYYRKYRIVIVNGTAYPYHLAISPRWMVHYQSSPMAEHAWMRAEEEAFLRNPAGVFPRWKELAREISAAIGLDYVGLDVTRLVDGTMLVFEADPAMLVHDEDQGGIFAYKRHAIAAIREALHRLIESRAT
jgi:hypothetical protein